MPYTPADPTRPWIADENGHIRCHHCAGTGAVFYLDRYEVPVKSPNACVPCHGSGRRYQPQSLRKTE